MREKHEDSFYQSTLYVGNAGRPLLPENFMINEGNARRPPFTIARLN